MQGLIGYSAYVPFHRLRRQAINEALSRPKGSGTRSVASYDEDAATMAVEAARFALADLAGWDPKRLWFSTSIPPYLDKSNATLLHAALGLDSAVMAADLVGSVRSGVNAFLAAADSSVPTLVTLADLRVGRPGGADESAGGDAAAALVFDQGSEAHPVIADVLGHATATTEILERWRLPTEATSHTWEDRFGEDVLVPLAQQALNDALKHADLGPADVHHLVVSGLHDRAARSFVAGSGIDRSRLVNDQSGTLGNSGVAQFGVTMSHLLDDAGPDEVIALTVLGDGASVVLLRTTDALSTHRASRSVAGQIASTSDALSYTTYLSWRGILDREPPRRPDPDPAYAPPSRRNADFKFGFVGARCNHCGTIHLPPVRACNACGTFDDMSPIRMSEKPATITHLTIDRLAFTPSPPLVAAAIDFEGGGRLRCQITDMDAESVSVGDHVEMTFRRLLSSGGIHNYFWKARPARFHRQEVT
jgi:hydroxymethylglutaryl-CoA synthase